MAGVAHLLLVRVLDPDGRPVVAADAEFHSGSSTSMTEVSEGNAKFDLSAENPAQTGWLEVKGAKDADGALLPLGRLRMPDIRAGQRIEVRLPPEMAIQGRVLGPDGAGLAGARVRADPVGPPGEDWPRHDEPWLWRRADDVRTDAAGSFRIGRLGGGAHRVFVLPPAEWAPPDPVEALAGDASVELRLRPGLEVRLSVLDSDGAPVSKARVVVARAREDPLDLTIVNLFTRYGAGTGTTAEEDGSVRLRGLDSLAPYVLGVRGPPSRADLAEHVETRWFPSAATIRLGRGQVVAGVVRDPAGRPVAGVLVSCERSGGVQTSHTTTSDGLFRFTGLAAGPVRLEARIFSTERTSGSQTSRTVRAGAEDVVFVLDDGDR